MVLMFFMTKLTGDKQISQMSAFDYIAGITIGSSAAEMAIGGEVFLPAAVATAAYGVAAFLISYVCNKSVKARRFLNGEPVILYRDGIFYKRNMAKVRLDMGEFLTQCRGNGYFSLKEIGCAIMECNGKVSFLPAQSSGDGFSVNIVIDGRVIKENLLKINKNKWWLMHQLDQRGIKLGRVMLATVEEGRLEVYPFSENAEKNTLFE